MPFDRLSALLRRPTQGLGLNPVTQSVLAQQLLAQSMQGPQGLVSPSGTINKALQGFLAGRGDRTQQQQQGLTSARQQALAGALSRAQSGDPAQAEAARRAASIIAGGLPEDPLAQKLLGAQAQSIYSPQQAGADPAKVQEYAYAKKNGFSGSFTDYLNEFYGREVAKPANVRSAEFYEGLTPEQRLRYQEANRNVPVENIGGVPNRVGPGGSLTPLSTIDTESTGKERLAQAQARGAATGEATGGIRNVRLQAAIRRLDRVKQASQQLGFGGPVVGQLAGMTPSGQELDQANAQLMTELSALTRVPGIGSQSDLEQRLQQLQLPTSNMYAGVRAKAIAELESFMKDLDAALNNVGGAGGESAAPPQSGMPDLSKMSDEELRRLAGVE